MALGEQRLLRERHGRKESSGRVVLVHVTVRKQNCAHPGRESGDEKLSYEAAAVVCDDVYRLEPQAVEKDASISICVSGEMIWFSAVCV
jgi:hypothetical protein